MHLMKRYRVAVLLVLAGMGMGLLAGCGSGGTISVGLTTPYLAFINVPTQTYGNPPFTVSASSQSSGTITYTVVSGPATISGNTVTLTGSGTVTLEANQAASGDFTAATATTSFLVLPVGGLQGASFSGRVQAAGQPVIGASVQLYAAGTGGNGSAGTAKLTTALTTDANGVFTVPSGYACNSTNTVLYLLAKGGKAGTTGTTNSALWLMVPLPPCGSITNTTAVMLNEMSTVASAAALAQFYSAGGNIGASSTNALGLGNAVLTEQTLANMGTGVSPGASVAANVSVNSAKLNSLADVFPSCAVNISVCGGVFAAATAGGSVPTNTVDAAFNIARNPGSNVAAVYTLATGTQFSPTLNTMPPDWTTAITVSGGGLNEPTQPAVDTYGNVWTANYNGVLSEFTSTGAAVFSSGITGSGLHESYSMAIDAGDHAWVVNDETPGSPYNGGTVSEFTNAGVPISSGIGYTGGNTKAIYFPEGIAADTSGDMWVANYGNSTYALLTQAGTLVTTNCNANGCSGGIEFPVAVAADSNHNGWFANQSSNTVTKVSLDGTSVQSFACCDGASGIAIDSADNVWVANYFGDSISQLTNSGTVVSSGYTAGGQIAHPQGIATDGAGDVWVANYRGGDLSELEGATAPSPGSALSPVGYGTDADLSEPYGMALDASGNIWVSNFANNTVVEFVGLAVPVKTPLVGATQAP